MQEEQPRRTNQQRTGEMRARLLSTARALFVAKGYTQTSTPEIVEGAGVTRGALYHHFANKQDIFRAVIEEEAAAVARTIEGSGTEGASALDQLIAGSEAYLDAMAVEGRTRLLLVEGPAVLGASAAREIGAAFDEAALRDGLRAAIEAGDLEDAPLSELTDVLSGMFERAALEISQGKVQELYSTAIRRILTALFT